MLGWEVDGICERGGGVRWLEMEGGLPNPLIRLTPLRSRFPSLDAKEVLCVVAAAEGVCVAWQHK